MAVVRPFGSESNLSLTVTASVFLSELAGRGNHTGSGGDEKMDAPPGRALNLTTLYKKRESAATCRSIPHSHCLAMFASDPVIPSEASDCLRRKGQAMEGLINAIFVRALLR